MTSGNATSDVDAMLESMAGFLGQGATAQAVLLAHPELGRQLAKLDSIKTAASVGGLLTHPGFQSNQVRIEALVHLCLCVGGGTRAPSESFLIQAFKAAGTVHGHLEDPPEDIFVGNISSKRGNYLVLEGLWESATFHLQLFVDLVDSFPDGTDWLSNLADSVHALLKISDIVCRRAGLEPNGLGSEKGHVTLPRKWAEQSSQLRARVHVTPNELANAGIQPYFLGPFLFHRGSRERALTQLAGNTDLERAPLVRNGDDLWLVLPNAVSVAIRRLLLMQLAIGPNRSAFLRHWSRCYSQTLSETPVIGQGSAVIEVRPQDWGAASFMVREVDVGRHLVVAFVMDTLVDFEEDQLAGTFLPDEILTDAVSQAVAQCQANAEAQAKFRSGVVLLVGCGVGRSLALPDVLKRQGWRVQGISAADYCTLGWTNDMEPLHLWRLLDMEQQLVDMGVILHNINGLLNMFGWARGLEGHLVPHASMPADALGQPEAQLFISQNALRELRHKTAVAMDRHMEPYVDGSWRQVLDDSRRKEPKRELRVYGSLSESGPPLGVTISSIRPWWWQLVAEEDGKQHGSYDLWRMMGEWLARMKEPLEAKFGDRLGAGPLLVRCAFSAPPNPGIDGETVPGSLDDALTGVTATVSREERAVTLKFGSNFHRALFNPENIAERELVRTLARAVADLAGADASLADVVTSQVVRNPQARHVHRLQARGVRDYLQSLIDEDVVVITDFDSAASKLGLGWRARARSDGTAINGKTECLDYLRKLVTSLEDRLLNSLREFSRTALITRILTNYEAASASRDRWHRTAAANLAMAVDRDEALRNMREHEFRLNAVYQASRNLIEMAVCECPVQGAAPGALDLSRLMAGAAEIFHYGGWSDLIRWDFMPADLVVRPLGDVHGNLDFLDTVLRKFADVSSQYRFEASADEYERHFEAPRPADSGGFGEHFLTAWESDFGFSIDDARQFTDALDDLAVASRSPVCSTSRSRLLELPGAPSKAALVLDFFTLAHRDQWREVPVGFDVKDIQPWRFRRALSSLRRPMIQVSSGVDPEFIFAPGMVREGLASTMSNYYEGAYPDRHLGRAMRSYVGFARRRDGAAFNEDVAHALREHGWEVETEVPLTKILRRTLDRNYGDVDVLAWRRGSNRVLVVECKDLQFKKTYGEIAEQLSDFRGEVADGKRDLLRKHLDRYNLLSANDTQVAAYLGLKGAPNMESHLVFRHPVPMQFVGGQVRERATLHTLMDLKRHGLLRPAE